MKDVLFRLYPVTAKKPTVPLTKFKYGIQTICSKVTRTLKTAGLKLLKVFLPKTNLPTRCTKRLPMQKHLQNSKIYGHLSKRKKIRLPMQCCNWMTLPWKQKQQNLSGKIQKIRNCLFLMQKQRLPVPGTFLQNEQPKTAATVPMYVLTICAPVKYPLKESAGKKRQKHLYTRCIGIMKKH